MLIKLLKLLGLDIPAKMEAAKASLELRVEQVTNQMKRVAADAAVIVALSTFATLTAVMAFGVGLIALYRWTAEAYGVYAGLGLIGAILVVVTAIAAASAVVKSNALAQRGARTAGMIETPRHMEVSPMPDPNDIAAAAEERSGLRDSIVEASDGQAWTPRAAVPAPTAAASDLIEPLGYFLSRYIKYPTVGNPIVDELIGTLRTTAHSTTDEAVGRAANVIRYGSRANLVVVLVGAGFLGWLVTHHSRHQ